MGRCRYRTTGMSLTVDLKYSNLQSGGLLNDGQTAPIRNANVDATLAVSDEAGWAGSGPVCVQTAAQATCTCTYMGMHMHMGMDMHMCMCMCMPSLQPYVPSLQPYTSRWSSTASRYASMRRARSRSPR